jgi:methyl-accepting chemotaxis protein
MHQLAGAVRKNSENAREANDFAAGASRTADAGGQAMTNVVGTMDGIAEASRRISEIAGLIDSIAFQTNILALNAAVEAARAGEQGRGFAVVASEVRALAQRSATAAKDVKQLIRSSVERVDKGTQLVQEAGRTIHEIVGSVQRVTEMMSRISVAGDEQLSGIEQVSDTVAQMDRVVQQNASLVAESAAAAASLADHAEELLRSVERFRLEGDAGPQDGAAPEPAHAPDRTLPRPVAAPALPDPIHASSKGISA